MNPDLVTLGLGLAVGLVLLILLLRLLPGPGDEHADLQDDRFTLGARDDVPRRRSPLRRLLRLLGLR